MSDKKFNPKEAYKKESFDPGGGTNISSNSKHKEENIQTHKDPNKKNKRKKATKKKEQIKKPEENYERYLCQVKEEKEKQSKVVSESNEDIKTENFEGAKELKFNNYNKNKNMSKSVVDAYQKKKKSYKYTPAKNTQKSRK